MDIGRVLCPYDWMFGSALSEYICLFISCLISSASLHMSQHSAISIQGYSKMMERSKRERGGETEKAIVKDKERKKGRLGKTKRTTNRYCERQIAM